jgi:hypothetical protein
MNKQGRTDPLDELRRADPVHHSPAPSESKARVWARIQEATMDDTKSTSRRRLAWAGGLAVAGVAGVAALALLLTPGTSTPVPSDDPGTGIGSCVETYSPETLANREFAFDGSVAAIEGDSVTFSVNETFAGEATAGDSVTLSAPGMSGTSITSAGGPTLTIGDRYLVAGDGGFVWACGFTQRYDQAVAAQWAEATR